MFLNLFIFKNGLENVFYIHYNDTKNIKTETNILNKIKQILSTNFKYPINDMEICILVSLFIFTFPLIPTGSAFNNWLSVLHYLAFGFYLAIVCMAAIRFRLRYSNVPDGLKGLGITMILTGLLSMAYLSFSGIQL